MKRIVDGLTYNTDTAARVAEYEYRDDRDREVVATLYVTSGGAFFLVHRIDAGDVWKYDFEPFSRDEVDALIAGKGSQIEVFDEAVINAPPEAVAEREESATIYLRVPKPLKARIEAAAEAAKLSVNSWLLRCSEGCLGDGSRRGSTGGENAERSTSLKETQDLGTAAATRMFSKKADDQG